MISSSKSSGSTPFGTFAWKNFAFGIGNIINSFLSCLWNWFAFSLCVSVAFLLVSPVTGMCGRILLMFKGFCFVLNKYYTVPWSQTWWKNIFKLWRNIDEIANAQQNELSAWSWISLETIEFKISEFASWSPVVVAALSTSKPIWLVKYVHCCDRWVRWLKTHERWSSSAR